MVASKFTRQYLQRLASLDVRDPSVVQTRLKILEDVGLERFLQLGPGIRFKATPLPSGKLAARLKVIEDLPAAQREQAKIAYLARTRFGQALLPLVYDKQREYGTLLGALNWLGIKRFRQLAEDDFDLNTVPGLQRQHPDRQVMAIRSSILPVEEQQAAVAQVLKSTALGQHVLEFGSVPTQSEEAWEEAILAYIGGPERFLRIYKKPAFDIHTMRGVYDRPFSALVAQVQKADLSKEDEERAYVALLSYTAVGKRILDGAGLPQPAQTVRGRPLRPEKTSVEGTKQPLQSHVDLLEHIGRDRFLQLVEEPLFDLESIEGWESTGTSVPSRRRLIEHSNLSPEEKERALVALLAIRPTPFMNDNELYRSIIRRTPQYRRGASGRASEYYFPKLLAEVGPSRFVRLARQPLYDLSDLLTAKDAGKWGLNRKFERVRRSNLSDEDKERAFVSILARSRVGKRYLEEAAAARTKPKTFEFPAILANPTAPTSSKAPGDSKWTQGSDTSLTAPKPQPASTGPTSETAASAVTRFALARVPFLDCDRRIEALAGSPVFALARDPRSALQAVALLGLFIQATMSGV